jgi:hypothetical protein
LAEAFRTRILEIAAVPKGGFRRFAAGRLNEAPAQAGMFF